MNHPVIQAGFANLAGSTWTVPVAYDVDLAGLYRFEFYRYASATKSYEFVKSADAPVNVGIDDHVTSVQFTNGTELNVGEVLTVLAVRVTTISGATPNLKNTSEMSPPTVPIFDTGPRVIDVQLDNPTGWARDPYSFATLVNLDDPNQPGIQGQQLRPIATQNVNEIKIVFNEHVQKRAANGTVGPIDGSVLRLEQTVRNSDGSVTNTTLEGSSATFSYEPMTFTATWTFATPLADGKYAIHLAAPAMGVAGVVDSANNPLNGEWDNLDAGTPDDFTDDPRRPFIVGGSTPGSMANKFRFHFALLAGDYDGDGMVEHGGEAVTGDGNGDGSVNGGDAAIGANGSRLPLSEVYSADFNQDERIDAQDLTIWRTGFGITVAGDADGDGDSDGNDFLIWQRMFGAYTAWADGPPGGSVAEAYAAALGMSLEDLTLGLTPRVMNVIISGSLSTHAPYAFNTVDGSGEQLRTVPVGLADTVSIVFSENVNVDPASLIVVGMTTANVPILAEFDYDPFTYTATWRFEGWALGDNYILHLMDGINDGDGNFLDGEWVNPASRSTTNALVSEFPSGDGVSGGNFVFAMTLLPGDANGDNVVSGSDYYIWSNHYAQDGSFSEGDFDGDGIVGPSDFDLWLERYGMQLHTLKLKGDLDGDWDVDANDLDVIADNAGMTGATWEDGDLDGDGEVTEADLDFAFTQYGLGIDLVS